MAAENLRRCVIISGSPDVNTDFIKKSVKSTDYVICADSGYVHALKCNIVPELFVGDMDSFDGSICEATEKILLNTHKDDTDTLHCLNIAIERGFKDVVILGGTGGRTDHTLANISALEYAANQNVKAILLSDIERIELIGMGEHIYKGFKGKTFSVFPFGCSEAVVTYKGDVEYPLSSYTLTSSVALGISNVFNSDNVNILIEKGKAIVIINT